jgi:flagellar hook-basal body complex protein FliE
MAAIDLIEGLPEALAARTAVQTRLKDLQGRLTATTDGIQRAKRQRGELVERTAAGEDVPAAEISAIDGTIAELESKEAMLREAVPNVEREVSAADREVIHVIRVEGQKRLREVNAAYEKAEARVEAAAAERNRLGQAKFLWAGFHQSASNEEWAIRVLTSPHEAMRI